MAFADIFLMLTAMFVAMSCVTLFMKRPQAAAGGGH